MKKKRSLLGRIIIWGMIITVIGSAMGGSNDDKDSPSPNGTRNDSGIISEVSETDSGKKEEEIIIIEPQTDTDNNNTAIRTELKEFLDSYEAFIDVYCEFMQNYDSSDMLQLTEYAQLLSRYADFVEKADAWDEEEMNTEELLYYTEVMAKSSQKLIVTGLEIQ